jgi:type IV pilus assembly protein PilW
MNNLTLSLCKPGVPIRSRAVLGRRNAGFTMVELMVALTLGLLILVGLVALFANQSVARGEMDKASRQIENGRFALQTLGDDIRHAGFFGPLVNAPAVPAAVPDPCSTTTANVMASIGIPLQGYSGDESVAGFPTCLNGHKANTAVLVVRRAGTAAAGAFTSGEFNIQVSGCAGDPDPHYVVGTTASVFTLHKNTSPGCTPITTAPTADISPLYVRIYYISCNTSSGVACGAAGADGVPTLQRVDVTPPGKTCQDGTTSTAANPCITPIVDGIENMQFEYGVDTTNDGAPDSYTDTPPDATKDAGTPAPTVAGRTWQNVMSVRVYLLSRNIDPTGAYSDAKTYSLGGVSVTPSGADLKFKRHAYSELVRLNNPAGRRE